MESWNSECSFSSGKSTITTAASHVRLFGGGNPTNDVLTYASPQSASARSSTCNIPDEDLSGEVSQLALVGFK